MAEEFGASIVIKLVDKVSGTMQQMMRDFLKFGDAVKKSAGGLDRFANNMTLLVTLPLTTGLLAAATITAKLEDSVVSLRGSLQGTPEEIFKITKEISKLSYVTPTTSDKLLEASKAFTLMGVSNSKLVDFTHNMVAFGHLTGLSAEQAGTAIIELGTALGLSEDKYTSLGDTIISVGKKMRTNQGEILKTATQIASTARDVGFSMSQTLGLAGFFSGLNVKGAGGTLSAVMRSMQEAKLDSEKAAIFGAVTGLGSAGFFERMSGKKGGPMSALQAFVTRMPTFKGGAGYSPGMALAKLGLPDDTNTILAAAKNIYKLVDALDATEKGLTEEGVAIREAESRWITFSQQMKMNSNILRGMVGEIGTYGLPALKGLSSGMRNVLMYFENLPPTTKKAAGVLAVFAAAIGPVAKVLALLGQINEGLKVIGITLTGSPLMMLGGFVVGVTAAILALHEAIKLVIDTPIGKWMMAHSGMGMAKGTTYGALMGLYTGQKTGEAKFAPQALTAASAVMGGGVLEIIVKTAGGLGAEVRKNSGDWGMKVFNTAKGIFSPNTVPEAAR